MLFFCQETCCLPIFLSSFSQEGLSHGSLTTSKSPAFQICYYEKNIVLLLGEKRVRHCRCIDSFSIWLWRVSLAKWPFNILCWVYKDSKKSGRIFSCLSQPLIATAGRMSLTRQQKDLRMHRFIELLSIKSINDNLFLDITISFSALSKCTWCSDSRTWRVKALQSLI